MKIETLQRVEIERKEYLYLEMETNKDGIVFYTIYKEFSDGDRVEIEQLNEETVARAIFNEIVVERNQINKSIEGLKNYFTALRKCFKTSDTTEASKRHLQEKRLYQRETERTA